MTPREMFERVVAAYNAHDWDGLAALWTDDAEIIAPGAPGRRGGRDWAEFNRTAAMPFPDARVVVHELIVDGNKVVQESTLMGTHTEPFERPDGTVLPPTGRTIEIRYMEIFWAEGDQVGPVHLYVDPTEISRQLEPPATTITRS